MGDTDREGEARLARAKGKGQKSGQVDASDHADLTAKLEGQQGEQNCDGDGRQDGTDVNGT